MAPGNDDPPGAGVPVKGVGGDQVEASGKKIEHGVVKFQQSGAVFDEVEAVVVGAPERAGPGGVEFGPVCAENMEGNL
jgi:hypothetical protein